MNTFINSYAMFFTVFVSMFVLVAFLDWLCRRYNLRLSHWFGHSDGYFSDSACEQDARKLQNRVDKLEAEVNSLLRQNKA